MTDAGKLTKILSFQKKQDGDDGFGNPTPGTGAFLEVFKTYGSWQAKAGTNPVAGSVQISARPVIIKVRYDQNTAAVDNSFRVVDLTRPESPPLNIVSISDPDGLSTWLHITATMGGLE